MVVRTIGKGVLKRQHDPEIPLITAATKIVEVTGEGKVVWQLELKAWVLKEVGGESGILRSREDRFKACRAWAPITYKDYFIQILSPVII